MTEYNSAKYDKIHIIYKMQISKDLGQNRGKDKN